MHVVVIFGLIFSCGFRFGLWASVGTEASAVLIWFRSPHWSGIQCQDWSADG
jgi:hypothetical protein